MSLVAEDVHRAVICACIVASVVVHARFDMWSTDEGLRRGAADDEAAADEPLCIIDDVTLLLSFDMLRRKVSEVCVVRRNRWNLECEATFAALPSTVLVSHVAARLISLLAWYIVLIPPVHI